MTSKSSSRNRTWLGAMEDCESSFTIRLRCRRRQLLAALPLITLASILLNVALMVKYKGTFWDVNHVANQYIQFLTSPKNQQNFVQRRQQERRIHSITPMISSLSHEAFFSGCLQIKDDNQILNEWIAYHYFVINMRHLIVAVDPLSSESPSPILEKWRNLTDLQILTWQDGNFMPKPFLESGRPPLRDMQYAKDFASHSETDILEISNHRYRQRVFLAQCMKVNRALNHTWVIHIDTDEYIVASKLLRQMKPSDLPIPPMDQPGSVLRLLQSAVSKSPKLVHYPCISMLRVLFGSVESRRKRRDELLPGVFNSSAFETLRWRYHGIAHNMSVNGNPKVLLDISAIPERSLPNIVFSIHRPVFDFCSRNDELKYSNYRRQPIAVNHYLGSWERYSGRLDKRRSREKYETKANQRSGKDDGVKLWINGFLLHMGKSLAIELLGEHYLIKGKTRSLSAHSVMNA